MTAASRTAIRYDQLNGGTMPGGMGPRRISIFDTTLRDGEQAPGNAMSAEQKLDLALRIEALGVDYIETGFPASSPSEFEATRLISTNLKKAQFVTFCRGVREDVEIAVKAGGTANHEIQVLATGSDLHLEHKRRITRKEAIDEVVDAVNLAHSLGVESVLIGIEDATRGKKDLLRALTESAIEVGAVGFVIGDTSGCMTPAEYAELIATFREWAPEPLRVSTHCHDDFGLSLANAVAGLQAGANEAQTTLGGIGERAGNTALEELVALLAYKREQLGLYTEIDTVSMFQVYSVLRGVIGLAEPRNKAIFGAHAFGTAAGIHQQGILRNPATYEFVEPAKFGRERAILIARHSGRSVLRYLLDELGVHVDEEQLNELYRVHIMDRTGGDCEDISVFRQRLVSELIGTAP